MRQLYNLRVSRLLKGQNGLKLVLIAASSVALTGTISCRKATTATPETPLAPSGKPAAEAIAEADKLYGERADLVKIREGIVSLRQAQADDPENFELAWRLAKFNYYLGAHSPNSGEQDKAFHDGIEAGKLATKLQEGKAEGHFWLGANYGGSAQVSTLSGLSEFDDIKREMEAVLKIDERFQAGSAYMVLGQLYLEAPRLLGGDVEEAIINLEKGLKFGPDNSLMHLRLAQAYLAANRKEDARREIDTILKMKPASGYEPEHVEAVTEARKLEEKVK